MSPEDPVDGGHGGDGGGVTDPLGEQLVPDLPGEHPWGQMSELPQNGDTVTVCKLAMKL